MIPYLLFKPPSGEEFCLQLTQSHYTLGRLPDNDIVIPETLVSREHCHLEQSGRRWCIIDLESRNHTYLRQNSQTIKLNPKQQIFLDHEDVICILDWEITFYDSNRTGAIITPKTHPAIAQVPFVYNVATKTLYYQNGNTLEKLRRQPRPLLNRMIAHMADRNLGHGEPVCCSFQELKQAIWGETQLDLRSDGEIHGLASELRRIFAKYVPKETIGSLLETRPGQGYILNIKWQ